MSDEEKVETTAEDATDAVEPSAIEETAAEPEPAAVPAAEPVQEAMPAPAAEAPKAGGKGLMIGIAVAVVVVIVAVGVLLARGSLPGTGSSSARPKITTALGFVEAILDGDTMAIKPYLTDDAQNAATANQWAAIASSDTTGLVTFSTPVWTGDTKAFVTLNAQTTTGTMLFTYNAAKPLDVTMLATAGGTTETDTVTLVAAGTGWRVVSIANGTNKTVFNAAMIKSIIPTSAVTASGTAQ